MLHAVRVGAHIQPNDPFWVELREAVYQRAQQLGINLISIDIDPTATSLESQAAIVEELLSQELDALIGWDLPDDLIWRILEAGIAIIHLQKRDIRHPRFASSQDRYDAAQLVGEFLAEKLGGHGSVLVVGGMAGWGQDGRARLAGIHDALQAYAGIKIRHIPGLWRYEQAYSQFYIEMRQLNGPVDAIFGLSDSLALAGRDAGLALGLVTPQTLIVGINGDPLALAAIAAGSMTATVDTATSEHGRVVAELAYQAAQGLPLPPFIRCQRLLVTAQNVAEVAAQKLIAIADLPNRLVGVNRLREQQRLTQLETSLAINRRIGAILDHQQLSHAIANLIRTNYGYDFVQLLLCSEHEQALILDQPDPAHTGRVTIPLAESGVLGQALLLNETIFIPNAQHSHRFPPDPDWPDTRSRVVLPIRLGDRILGLLDLHSQQSTQHTRAELIGLQILADQLGIAMQNAELYSKAVAARARAEKADQLKTRLLANVSHELRTPLNVILGYSQAALASPAAHAAALPPTLQHDLQQIYRSGGHLQHLINDLLDLSRAEIGELDLFPETIDAAPLLREVFHSMADGIAGSGNVDWQMQVPDRLPLLQADSVRLRQILLNLLSNAHKFTQRGQITLGAEVAPPHLHIWVTDTGSGIPFDRQEHIFEPFVTEELPGRRPEGIGLGLCITRRLVLLHRGAITLESQPGRGSTFHVYLPLPNLHGPYVASALPDRPTLLLISAHDQPAPAIAELCRRQQLQLCRLRLGDGLAEALAEGQPAAIAWDLADPTPADWALIERIRSHPQLCQAPFIVYSQAHGDGSGLTTGLTNVLTKPIQGKTLLETINALRPADLSGPILIVDDDPQACEIYRRIAATALPNYTICMANGGAAALELLEQLAPSMVILDLSMPDVDGFAVLERLRGRQQTQQAPILIVSGRILSLDDIKRLDQAHVTFHSKNILAHDEAAAVLRRTMAGDDPLPQQTSTLVWRAVAYLQHNYTRPLSRQEIAEAIGVSKNYLSQIFHQELGISPWEFLNRYRVMQARALLNTTNESITTIAAQVGFDDSSYFGRVFHKHVGQSPREYREQALPSEHHN